MISTKAGGELLRGISLCIVPLIRNGRCVYL